MLATFQATLSPMLMLFLCILIGFLLNKAKIVPDNTETVLSKMENWVFLPALVVNTFMSYCTVDSIRENASLILYATGILVLAIAIAMVLSGVFQRQGYQRNVYRYALAFGNFGFMGNAIVPAILGQDMLYPYLLFTLPLQVGVYTWGMAILIPRENQSGSPLKSLVNPMFASVILGSALGLLGAGRYVPAFVLNALESLGGCMGPVAMILTGIVVGKYDFLALLKNKKVYAATLLRLLVLPALYLVLLRFVGADTTTMLLCMFAFGTPLGLNTVVFPAAYGGDTSTGASMAMISHTLSVLSIPLLYAVVSALIL